MISWILILVQHSYRRLQKITKFTLNSILHSHFVSHWATPSSCTLRNKGRTRSRRSMCPGSRSRVGQTPPNKWPLAVSERNQTDALTISHQWKTYWSALKFIRGEVEHTTAKISMAGATIWMIAAYANVSRLTMLCTSSPMLAAPNSTVTRSFTQMLECSNALTHKYYKTTSRSRAYCVRARRAANWSPRRPDVLDAVSGGARCTRWGMRVRVGVPVSVALLASCNRSDRAESCSPYPK